MIDRLPYVRPSSLSALELCPGRALMEARAIALVPVLADLESAPARQGTLGHAMAAQFLAFIYHSPAGKRDPAECLARLDYAMHDLEPWTKDATRRCVAYVVAVMDREEARGVHPVLQIEMHLSGKGIAIGRGGTADIVIIAGDLVVVIDFKLGFLDQGHAADHLQLGAYACMAWDKYAPRTLEIHLAQGRLRDFTCATFNERAIEATRLRCKRVVRDAVADLPELKSAIDACRYCKSLVICTTTRKRIMDASHSLALFGADPKDRVKLAEDMAIAKRFIEEGTKLQKAWQAEAREQEAERVPA